MSVASPCSMPWGRMPGDERVRFCGVCRQNVYNIEALTRSEVQRLIADREGRVCARIRRRADGTVVTRDCGAASRAVRRKGFLQLLFMMVAIGWAQVTAATAGLARLRALWAAAWPRAATPVRHELSPTEDQPPRPEPQDHHDMVGGLEGTDLGLVVPARRRRERWSTQAAPILDRAPTRQAPRR